LDAHKAYWNGFIVIYNTMPDIKMLYDRHLYIDSLSFSRGGRKIISSLFLTFGPNEVIGILGKNGSGKSTLMNIIFGAIKPDFAFMRCRGVKFEKGYRTKEIVYLPQEGFLPRELRLSEALRLFEIDDPYVLDLSCIQENLNSRLRNLSSGMIRFIETLILLHTKHSFVLLDEPFLGLSPIFIEQISAHIEHVRHRKGILIADHNFRQVMDVSDRLYLLKDSHLIDVSTQEDLVFEGYIKQID